MKFIYTSLRPRWCQKFGLFEVVQWIPLAMAWFAEPKMDAKGKYLFALLLIWQSKVR